MQAIWTYTVGQLLVNTMQYGNEVQATVETTCSCHLLFVFSVPSTFHTHSNLLSLAFLLVTSIKVFLCEHLACCLCNTFNF